MKDSSSSLDFSLVLASSVHDMKNSLGMLLSSLEGIIQETPPENDEQAKRFATLQYETSRINGELIQLLSVYRMQKNRMPLHIDEHFVIDLIEDQIARNHMLFETRNIEIDIQCDADLNGYFDNDLVGGVVHNVLINCARYTKQKLQVSAELVDKVLCIAIADDGEGYPEAMLGAPTLSSSSDAFNSGSTNLGLFFANEVAKLHCQNDLCGRIELSNNGPLGGGVFKLYIP